MITLYDKKATDYTTNGLVVLDPYIISAKISERLNGEYKLDMELAVDQRTMIAANEMIVKAPAPIRETPQIDVSSTQTVTREIYKVTTGGQRLYLRVKPSQSARGIHAYKPGTEVAILDKSNSQWYKVAVLDGGASGYMYAANLTYVRSETQSQGDNKPQTVTTPAKTRDQLFRISKITSTLESIQIEALHISYDMRRNYVKSAAVKGKTGTDALAAVFAAAMTESDFTLYSDISKICEEDIAGKSLVAALLSDGGLVDQAGGEVLRDNYDLYWYNNIGYDRGVSITYRKNMAGMEIGVDTSDIITQIIPVGYDKKNNPIYGDPVDSAHVAEYAHPYIKEYTYKDVKVGKDYKNEAAVKTELAKRAAAEYDAKIDLPKVSAAVEYVDLKNTSAGRDFAAYTNVYIGDTVRIRHEDYGFDLVTKVVAYVWDCAVNEYESIELDNKQAQLSDIKINPSMIGNGTLASRKLGVGAVMNVNMAENSVESDQIAEGAIDNTNKMTQLVVDALSTASLTAQIAHINALTAGTIDADELTAAWAKLYTIIAGQIEAGTITADTLTAAMAKLTVASVEHAEIDWANISRLTAAMANIATAKIGDADVDFAQIKQMKVGTAVADQLITHDAVADRYFIDKLQVRALQVLEQTVGSLTVKAKDGSYYRLDIDPEAGTVVPTLVTPSDSEKAEGVTGDQSRCIIETDLTVADLAATNIKAINALIDKLTASRIEVDTLFAREAVTGALDSYLVRTSTIEALEGQLNVWANDKITLAVKDKVDTSTYNTGMAGKADASDLTALSGRVTTAETSITQNANAITSKASQSDLTALSGRVTTAETSITQNANAITSKASQSDLTALTGRVTTAESEIEQTPTKITAAVNAVEVGGTNMVRLGGLSIVNAGGSANEYLGRDWYRASEHQTTISAYDSTCWLQCPDIVITAGKQYTLSYYAWIQPGATAGANTFRPNLWGGTDDTDKYLTDLIPFVVGTPTKYSVTFDTTGWTTGTYTLRFVMLTGQTHEVYFTDIKLEEGTKATAWSPNPAEVRICSSILMDADHTEINTPYLDIDVSGTEGDMHIDENGISAGTATFGAINCSGVVRTYTGATAVTLGSGGTYGTMAALAEVINHSKLPDGLTVTVTSDIYGDCTLNGFYSDNAVTFNFAGHSYNGALYIRNCQAQSMTFNSMVYNGTGSDLALCIYRSSFVSFSACTFNFNNNPADSMGIYNGSDICMDGCGLYNGKYFIYLSGCAQLEMINCLGGNCTNFLGAHGGLFKARGTRPDGGVYDPGLCLMRPSDPTTLTVDSGSATPAVDPVTTASYTASVTGTYYPSGHWIGDNVIRQGHEGTGSSGRKDYGCMWFSASALSGKTIKSATLTIKRIAGKGRSSEVTMKLWTTTVTGKSGTMASSTLASLGEIGTIGNGETVTVAIPTSAISTIASGGGLVLYTEETANKTGKTYSEHYAHFEGTDGAAPVLTVTY